MCSSKHDQNKNPPETKKIQTEKGYELTSLPVLPLHYQSFLSSFLSTPAMLRGCLIGRFQSPLGAQLAFCDPCSSATGQRQMLFSHPPWAIAHHKHVAKCVFVNSHFLVASLPGAPIPAQSLGRSHPSFALAIFLYPKGSGQTQQTGSLSPFCKIPLFPLFFPPFFCCSWHIIHISIEQL